MKRYDHWCSLDGGGPAEPEESDDGGWVRYEDAIAAVAAERERCAIHAASAAAKAQCGDWNAACESLERLKYGRA